MTTAADLLLQRTTDDNPFFFEDGVRSYRELVMEGRRRAALHAQPHDPGHPPHVGILLDDTPEDVVAA